MRFPGMRYSVVLFFFIGILNAAPLVDFGAVAPESIRLHTPGKREQAAGIDTFDRRKALRIDWNNARAGHFEFHTTDKLILPEFLKAKILYAPGKAANAGGVSVSGLEMTQNAQKLSWSSEEVDQKLQSIMQNIHEQCVKYGTQPDGYVNYVKGANVAGFMKVAKAMMAQGIL